jgi:hypothetical protein
MDSRDRTGEGVRGLPVGLEGSELCRVLYRPGCSFQEVNGFDHRNGGAFDLGRRETESAYMTVVGMIEVVGPAGMGWQLRSGARCSGLGHDRGFVCILL